LERESARENANKKQPETLWRRLVGLCKKYEQVIRYIIVGGLTTVINYAVYAAVFLLIKGAPEDYQIANGIAFVASVAFAYIANKKAVFHSKTSDALDTAREAGSFFLMRLVSYGLEAGMMALMVRVLRMDELVAKIPANFLIVLTNYVFSKLFIFRSPDKPEDTAE